MSRSQIGVRDADPDDASALLLVWGDLLRRTSERSQRPPLPEVRASVARIVADPDQRLVVAVLDDEIVGAASSPESRSTRSTRTTRSRSATSTSRSRRVGTVSARR